LYGETMEVAARLEATLDFPEDELPSGVLDRVCEGLRDAAQSAETLLATWEEGHLLRDGAVVVISGRPNAGKSTLLNALLGKNRAIVSATPGTTRDSIEETLVLAGIPLRLVDTAGLRETECEIERQGIDRARSHMNEADLHVVVIDATLEPDPSECALVAGLPEGRRIVVLNKSELPGARTAYPVEGVPILCASLRDGVGLDVLRECMTELLGGRCDLAARPHGVVSERHRRSLVEALDEIKQAREWMAKGGEGGIVPAASHLRTALETLGLITGKTYQESLLDAIFSRFCIGK
jgi:tRNA modification GTPase